jgi:Tfp pilus assembly protein PilN
MKAVNLIPHDSRRDRSAGLSVGSLGPSHLVIALLVVVVGLTLLRVLAGNTVNDRKATLAALQSRVATEQASAQRLSTYIGFVQAAQQREAAVKAIADSRFPWQRSFDQLARALPSTTSLTSLSATTAAGSLSTGPTFALSGCADTANQNGIATVLRRLRALSGSPQIGFENSTRQTNCGNSFSLSIVYGASGTPSGTSSGTASSATAGASTTPPAATSTTSDISAATTTSVTTPSTSVPTATTATTGGDG